MGGVLLGLPVQVGFGPPFLFQLGEGGKEEEGRRKEGAPPLLVQFGLAMRGRPPLEALLSFPLKPIKAHYFPGGFR